MFFLHKIISKVVMMKKSSLKKSSLKKSSLKKSSLKKISLKKIPALATSLFAVTIFLTAGILSACSEIRIDTSSGNALITVDKTELSKEEAIYRLLEQKIAYEGDGDSGIWSRKIGSETMNDYVKEAVLDELTLYTASVVMADELGVYMTDEDKVSASKAAEETYTKVSAASTNEKYPVTLDAAKELYIKKATYEKVYDYVTRDIGNEITENSTKVICIDYVIIPAKDAQKAKDIYSELMNKVPFDEACRAAGYTPQMNQIVYPKTMNAVFESVAFALKDGEYSEVVESKDEYYIIHCIDDKLLEESSANYVRELTEAKQETFQNYYLAFSKNHKLNVNKKFWNKVQLSDF